MIVDLFGEWVRKLDSSFPSSRQEIDCPPPLTRPSKSDDEEALDKLQYLSLFSSYGDEIRSLALKTETFLNKERIEGFEAKSFVRFFSSSVN